MELERKSNDFGTQLQCFRTQEAVHREIRR